MIISFAATTPSLLAGAKDTTRRNWSEKTHNLAIRMFEEQKIIDAWDNGPFVKGSHKVAEILITEKPFIQNTRNMKDCEYFREGFQWMDYRKERITDAAKRQFKLKNVYPSSMYDFFLSWEIMSIDLTVVRFKVVKIIKEIR